MGHRRHLLEECLSRLAEVSEPWVEAACSQKRVSPTDNPGGQEWLAGPMAVARGLRLYREALVANGSPTVPRLSHRHGQWVARVFPATLQEQLMFAGIDVEIFIEPGKPPSQGRIYRSRPEGGVSLVLGAGNQTSIGPLDALYKLFVDNEVAVLKMNPVNEAAGPWIEKAFAPLVEAGVFRVIYGGAEVGRHVTASDAIDSIHITGSARTHDAIVWGGDPEEQARRKASGDLRFKKEITSELGCVTPVVVVPGNWSDAELTYQARHVAAMVTNNAGFNCTSTQVMVTAEGWPQRQAFERKVAEVLGTIPPRVAYYPGAADRKAGFKEQYPEAREIGSSEGDCLPWLLIEASHDGDDYAFTEEAFCGVLSSVVLPGARADDFLQSATKFCNERLWGTLSCTVLVDGRTARSHADALDTAIRDLRYGTVGINVWGGVGYGLVTNPWGAFPGHPLEDIGSGRGFVHNTFLFDHPEKTVLRGPFVIKPTPAWFPDHRNLAELGRRVARYEESPGWGRFVSVALAGIKG